MDAIVFNEQEKAILSALVNEVMECTSGEFGYMEDVSRCGFTKHEFAGYIGSLTRKGVFEYIGGEIGGQFALKEEFLNV